jgi:RNA polymerase sigma factor (sigma-70 family)
VAVPEGRGGGLGLRRAHAPAGEGATELFEQFSTRVYGYCLYQLGSREEAEDALQATYLNAFRSLRGGFVPDTPFPWLLKIAQNVCLTRLRASSRRGRIEWPRDLDALQDVVAAPEWAGEELFGLSDALTSLSERERRAILLREWQGLSYREVAAELGVTQSAVETLIFRARRSLAAALDGPPAKPARRRLVLSFDPAALLAGLKASLSGNVAANVATSVAVVAASATIATVPIGREFDPPGPRAAAAERVTEAPTPDAAVRAAPIRSARALASPRAQAPVSSPLAPTAKAAPGGVKARHIAPAVRLGAVPVPAAPAAAQQPTPEKDVVPPGQAKKTDAPDAPASSAAPASDPPARPDREGGPASDQKPANEKEQQAPSPEKPDLRPSPNADGEKEPGPPEHATARGRQTAQGQQKKLDQAVAAEPVAAEPVAADPVADEPVADESVAEEPVAEPDAAPEGAGTA